MKQVARDDERTPERHAMVRLIARHMAQTASETGIEKLDRRVREALEAVPRHRFVPDDRAYLAYEDSALPIGYGQTISQPFIVALMTQLAGVSPSSSVLEIGTGSGYQAAVLGKLAGRVYSIEIVPELMQAAAATLRELQYSNVEVRCGDGFEGWREHAPFDAILLTAAAPEIPPPLMEQLAPGGRMVVPVGEAFAPQELLLLRKGADGRVETVHELPVAFVPLTRSRD